MSSEVFEMMRQFDTETVELQMILQCAPVLAGLKIANLLNVKSEQTKEVRKVLNKTNLSICLLNDNGKKATILVYRKVEMEAYLTDWRVWSLLKERGYDGEELGQLLWMLSQKYKSYSEGKLDFPHEIGLFLGYPVEDVKGFIENKGKNFLFSGYWKVYQNVSAKRELFRKFERAEERLIKTFSAGGQLV